MTDLFSMFSLGVAASLAMCALPPAAGADHVADPRGLPAPLAAALAAPETAELRARGPAGLEAVLARYDRADPQDRAALAAQVDAVAGQRYATVSRLYWYTELDQAKRAARALRRPILALRMLGDLRDDLSCANSRLFRATLYAHTELSAFLRTHFVLYWSSERAVPTVTIDFGDGRKLVRTTTGNSAHYVLDPEGHVLDVLPGLYAPTVFQRELTASLALADRVRGRSDADRVRATIDHHRAAIAGSERMWQVAQQVQYIAGARFLLGASELRTAVARAQRATVSKAFIEVPDLRAIGVVRPGEVPDDDAAWSAIGQRVWAIGAAAPPEPAAPTQVARPPLPSRAAGRNQAAGPASLVLDAASRSLVAALHTAGPADPRATPAALARVIGRLEHHIVADTALNELTLRQAIRQRIVTTATTDFAVLNAWIYDQVFATPSSDPWLGLLARTEFTGLPGDGVVTP
jgi:hypothetical protein